MAAEKQIKLWDRFYDFFPEVDLPVTLSEEYSGIFTKYNKALPLELIETFILEQKLFFPKEEENIEIDEIEEYVPCFRLPETDKYYAIIYWKASLLKYEYILHTYNKKGETIAKQVLASTTSDGKNIRQIVATIDPDLDIYIMGGDVKADEMYDPDSTQAFSLEITPGGQIIHHFEEN